MSVELIQNIGLKMPSPENVEGLKAEDLHNLMKEFHGRLEEYHGESEEFLPAYFLELIRLYPKSMCSHALTPTLKELITMFYLESKPLPDTKDKDEWKGYSYEDLSVLFCKSKATIHEAIIQEQDRLKPIVTEAKLRFQVKKEINLDSMRERLKAEELAKLEQNNQKNNQTFEQTPI